MLQKNNVLKILAGCLMLIIIAFVSIGVVNGQGDECEGRDRIGRDNCYLNGAQAVEDCLPIESDNIQAQCTDKFLLGLDNVLHCDDVPLVFKAKCQSIVTLNVYPDNIEKCYNLIFNYQGECVKTYVQKKSISDLNYCLLLESSFQKDCAYQVAVNKYAVMPFPFGDKANEETKEVCNQYEGEIKQGCLDYFQFAKTTSKIVKIFGLGFLGILIFSVLGVLIPIVLFVVLIIFLVKRRREH